MSTDSSQKEYDLLIIGGGPAGLTAAAYAVRKRIETMLISEDLGGKTNYKFSPRYLRIFPKRKNTQSRIIQSNVVSPQTHAPHPHVTPRFWSGK